MLFRSGIATAAAVEERSAFLDSVIVVVLDDLVLARPRIAFKSAFLRKHVEWVDGRLDELVQLLR